MIKLLFCLLLALSTALASRACELSSATRSAAFADYVDNALKCLAAPADPAFSFEADLESHFVALVNAEREQRGLRPLDQRAEMRPAARFHSLDMGYNDYFGHDSPLGRGHVYRLSALDRTLLAGGSAENVAKFGPIRCRNSLDQLVSCASAPGFTAPSAASVVEDLHRKLMQSEGHRENILDPAMTHIAVGVVRKETGYFVSQLFARPVGNLDMPLPLRVRAGNPMINTVSIPDWAVRNLALGRDGQPIDLTDNRVPEDAQGDYTLYVRAEQSLQTDQARGTAVTTRWMYPTGPGLTVLPAR